MKKKFLVFCVAALLRAFLSGCGGTPPPQTGGAAPGMDLDAADTIP